MGHVAFSSEPSIVYVGVARLPQPLVTSAPALAVEIELAAASRKIVAVTTNLGFACLDRLLNETLVGERLDGLLSAPLLELEVRYCAPFMAALRVALQNAARQAAEATPRDVDETCVPAALAAPGFVANGNGAGVTDRLATS